jgi:hypothetical protein
MPRDMLRGPWVPGLARGPSPRPVVGASYVRRGARLPSPACARSPRIECRLSTPSSCTMRASNARGGRMATGVRDLLEMR